MKESVEISSTSKLFAGTQGFIRLLIFSLTLGFPLFFPELELSCQNTLALNDLHWPFCSTSELKYSGSQ